VQRTTRGGRCGAGELYRKTSAAAVSPNVSTLLLPTIIDGCARALSLDRSNNRRPLGPAARKDRKLRKVSTSQPTIKEYTSRRESTVKKWAVWGMLLTVGSAVTAKEQGTSCHLPDHEHPLRCIAMDVPLDYGSPGERLSLHVTVAPALRETARPDPLFVLAGGPGQPGSEILFLLNNAFRRVRATRDVVFIDQRGTGRSGKLTCDGLPDLGASESEDEKALLDCLQKLAKPYRHYTTANAARDLDEVRKTLGYRRVNIWGGSYGTRLGQTYARSFPEHVRSVVLDSVASPEQILGVWGKDAQASLDAMFVRCDGDEGCKQAFPDLRARFQSLLQTVESGQAKLHFLHPRTANAMSLTLTRATFVETIRIGLYSTEMTANLPFLIKEASEGRWQPFLAQMYTQSDWSLASMAYGLTVAVLCAEDMPRLTPEILASERNNSFLKGFQVERWPRFCPAVAVPETKYQPPQTIHIPVLLLSGALDPVTPPHRAETARKHMTHSQHLIGPTLSHGVSHLGCGPRLLREFLDAPERPVNGSCLNEIPLAPFMLTAAGPRP
jgi:pimeloyl-ACP methyl ester carboxylesterase